MLARPRTTDRCGCGLMNAPARGEARAPGSAFSALAVAGGRQIGVQIDGVN